MVTIQTADSVLKSYYLEAVTDALNYKVNPFLAQIQRTSTDVTGKDVKKAVRLGFNGGVGAGSEVGALPSAKNAKYMTLKAELKNLYGTIEISDKAIRVSANNEGAFVNLLNDEMQSLIASANYNFGRMLFGNGSGALGVVSTCKGGAIVLNDLNNVAEGMYVDVCDASGEELTGFTNVRIKSVDFANDGIVLDTAEEISATTVPNGSIVYLHGSKDNEISGLGAIFSDAEIYGQDRSSAYMQPYKQTDVGDMSETVLQTAIDEIENRSGSKVNLIICTWAIRRWLMEYYRSMNVALPVVELEGGYKAISFHGIPVVVDRFCPANTVYLLNTEDFKLHQLCDWQWLEAEDGKILKQVPGKPVYTATLVKYAELICERPCGQGILQGVKGA